MTATTQDILQHTEAGVCTLTFNRVSKKNSITAAMYAALADALQAGAQDDSVRAVVFQGDVSVFSAGNDIGDFLQQPTSTQDSPVYRFLHAIVRFPKPLIAAVCGPAVGIGTTMLLHCDLVYAGDNAMFSMPFINLGVCPENASSLLAPQIFGYQRAAELLLLGEAFNAETGLEIGLVNKVLPPLEVNAYVQSVARKLAAKPLSSLLATKVLLKKNQTALLETVIRDEALLFAKMLNEPAAREAMSAFMEKRKPDFSKL